MEPNARNYYRIARRTAGYTQERWAECIGVSPDSVRRYESGEQMPSDEVVRSMAEISGLSQVCYWHVCNKSALAASILPRVERLPLPQAVLQLIASMSEFTDHCDELIKLAADGTIDESERPDFERIAAALDGVVKAAIQLRYAEGGGL